jgi:pimeloyl-ACP methyl ester carboxylesterase
MPSAVLLCLLLLCSVAPAEGYDYPFSDPYAATVLGTPPEDQFSIGSIRPNTLWDVIPLHKLHAPHTEELLLHKRPVPEILWYDDAMQYSVALVPGKAPLLFFVAGTGASHQSSTCRFFQKIFQRAGFHVVTLSSPTHPNFVVSASTTQVPGYIPHDVNDLYRSMEAIVERIGRERISAYHLAGYSLGGTQAAFLAELDARMGHFGFQRVLLLNPAVSLMTSALRLDQLLSRNVASRAEAAHVVAQIISDLSAAYRASDQVRFGDELLFDLNRKRPLTAKEFQVLIGVAFRLSLASMVFASDVCTGAGYLVPRGHVISTSEPLEPYLQAAVGIRFEDYISEYLLPFLQFQDPTLTREQAIAACSLEAIAPFLRRATHVAVMTNADDPILSPENLEFLKQTFTNRLILYPVGGHCGNLRYRDNVAAILHFFTR